MLVGSEALVGKDGSGDLLAGSGLNTTGLGKASGREGSVPSAAARDFITGADMGLRGRPRD